MSFVLTYFDIDGTLVPGIGQPTQSSEALSALVDHLKPKTLIYPASSSSSDAAVQYVHAVVTGRPFSMVVEDPLLAEYLQLCSAIISNVGTQIHLRGADGSWSPCDNYTTDIQTKINYSPDAVRTALTPLSYLAEQPAKFNSALKLSYYAPSDWGTTAEVAAQVHKALTKAKLVTAYPVVSLDPERGDYNVDVLAAGTTKRGAIEFIHPIFEKKIRALHPDAKIVVGAAGDTGNDMASAEAMQQLATTIGHSTFFIAPSNATTELRASLLDLPTTPTFTLLTPQGEHANGLLESLRVMEETLSL